MYIKVLGRKIVATGLFRYTCSKTGLNNYGDLVSRHLFSIVGIQQSRSRLELLTDDTVCSYEFKLYIDNICVYTHKFKEVSLLNFEKPIESLIEETNYNTLQLRRDNKIDDILNEPN